MDVTKNHRNIVKRFIKGINFNHKTLKGQVKLFVAHFMYKTIQSALFKIKALQQEQKKH